MQHIPTRMIRAGAGLVLAGVLAAPLGVGAVAPLPGGWRQASENERVVNGTFDSGSAPWWNGANTAFEVVDGELCVDVTGGTANPWEAIIGQNAIVLEEGENYLYTFTARADRPSSLRTTVQLGAEPYTSPLNQAVVLTTATQVFSYTFTSNISTTNGQVTFQLGGDAESFMVCLDNISLLGGQSAPPGYEPDTGPAVRVNQHGYAARLPKRATFVTDKTAPLTWRLKSSQGAVVKSGTTRVFGADVASGDTLHLVDFSSYTRSGAGFVLEIDGIESYPFDIDNAIYNRLRYDALAYFYHNRSGIAIEAQYVGEEWARPAGHLGVAPNQGDINVPCAPGTCDYALDVRGGWYDAGDQGKYVVNGGISAWSLLNAYERTRLVPGAASRPMGDGTLRIPEADNGVPDILDEARWEVEFLLRMQVPQGEARAGMAHHKMHDQNWTALPTAPHLDAQPRYLRPPSTAATLNLAATAAQCARLWKRFDRAFAARCLTAAERAWAAAQANPNVLAPGSDGNGGGAYSDAQITDEFYWAAAELYITTGKSAYRSFLVDSPHFLADNFGANGFSWGDVAALGDLSLALVPNGLWGQHLRALRGNVVTAADRILATVGAQGYPSTIQPGAYVWGSNSQVLNNAIVLATAYDYTRHSKYLVAVVGAMDYVLGVNALNQSYVSGYGAKPMVNPHHRFWARVADPDFPPPPPGALAGGPNSALQDPVASQYLTGCAPQKCYIDHIESYSTNEVAINWNAALAWVAAFVSEKASFPRWSVE